MAYAETAELPPTWLMEAVSRLTKLPKRSKMAAASIKRAIVLLRSIEADVIEAPRVELAIGDGVMMTWTRGPRELTVCTCGGPGYGFLRWAPNCVFTPRNVTGKRGEAVWMLRRLIGWLYPEANAGAEPEMTWLALVVAPTEGERR